MPKESHSKHGEIVVGKDEHGRKVLGKIRDFDAKGRGILESAKGPRGGVERTRVTVRKTIPVPAETPSRLTGRKER